MDKTSKISLGLVLALFPIIIGAVIWVTTEITTIKTAHSGHVSDQGLHHERFKTVESQIKDIDGQTKTVNQLSVEIKIIKEDIKEIKELLRK